MNSIKSIIFTSLIIFFLAFSFYPTLFELSLSNRLTDSNREFVLEHNYYWPDFNLYLSKIRQGWEGRITALERYTSERHSGSLIQEFYVVLGHLGRNLGIDPNMSYQLGRIILSPLLLILILMFVRFYFKSFWWQILAYLVIVISGSFPRFFMDESGVTHIGRFMEWWSNIDAVQRITFIPHILFGQVVSFYLLYHLTIKKFNILSTKKFIFFIFLGNAAGLVFPPSLITLNSVLLLHISIQLIKKFRNNHNIDKNFLLNIKCYLLYVFLTLPSLIYLLVITKQIPWSSLVDFHRTHPMMIPFDQYILGTGPIIILGLFGAIISIIKKEIKFQPLILWIIITFSFASFFSVVKEQSPLRFTQTGLFAPMGILGTYFFYQLYHLSNLSYLSDLGKNLIKTGVTLSILFYLLVNLYMMKVSLDWQTTFITQRAGASFPAVPYPPQTMYPLKSWMDAIRWLRSNTKREDVVLAKITAGNYIPAYAGNTVYFGQSNTVDYENKQILVDKFYKGEMNKDEALLFLQKGRIKFVFYSIQEKEIAKKDDLKVYYPFIIPVYNNPLVTIYQK